jgi:N utilization substance protein A
MAYVIDVLEVARGPQIILSRTHPNLVVKLFDQEVPEIAEGIVTIEGVAREAGVRTKIAVRSRDSDVDPVGACVGMKGARVQAVVQELRGEKIDIVPFDEDDARFVCNALAPAEVTRVLVDETNHTMQIVVPDDQLSLAIGRRGQNVRLAAELAGWKIDITSETKVAEEKEVAWSSLSRIEPLTEFQIQTLYNHGFRGASDVLTADVAFLAALPGFGEELVPKLLEGAGKVVDLESNEREEERQRSRQGARILLAIDDYSLAQLEAGKTGEMRMGELDGIHPYAVERLVEALYEDPEDIYFDEDIQRLVTVAGFSPGKARQIRFSVSQAINKATGGLAPEVEKPLAEPEERDAADYDAMNMGSGSDGEGEGEGEGEGTDGAESKEAAAGEDSSPAAASAEVAEDSATENSTESATEVSP